MSPPPKLNIHKSHSAVCTYAVDEIIKLFQNKENPVIGLATGNTMEPIFEALVKAHENKEIDLTKGHYFQLDEFEGAAPDHEASFNYAVRKLLLDKVGVPKENQHLINGATFSQNAAANSQEFAQEMEALGGVDIQLLGIGQEGHIGFNEKGAKADGNAVSQVTLASSTIEGSAASWGGQSNVPKTAITQSMDTILKAKRILFLANGGHKAEILRKALSEETTITQCPARALLDHKNTDYIIDKASSELLSETQLAKLAGYDEEALNEHKQHFASHIVELENGETFTLPHNAIVILPELVKAGIEFDFNNPDHLAKLKAMLKETTSIYAGAHPDDAELWCPHEIEKHFGVEGKPEISAEKDGKPVKFLNIIMTDGGSYVSALKRNEDYPALNPEELVRARAAEQKSVCAKYNYPTIMLQYPSKTVQGAVTKDKTKEAVDAMQAIYQALPALKRSYTHHPEDIHRTHLACANISTQAMRQAFKANKFAKDVGTFALPAWGQNMTTENVFPMHDPTLVSKLLKHFDTQIKMQGRGYDLMGEGNVRANCFQYSPHEANPPEGAILALDTTNAIQKDKPLIDVAFEASVRHFKKAANKTANYYVDKSPDQKSLITRALDSALKQIEKVSRNFGI